MPWAKTINRMLNEPAGELSSREKDKSAKKAEYRINSVCKCMRARLNYYWSCFPALSFNIIRGQRREREDSTKDGLRLLSLSLINKFN
jgi:hypothetical protein